MKNWSPLKWIAVVGVAIVAFYFLKGFGKGLASSTAPLP
jgi:hypothetical protein